MAWLQGARKRFARSTEPTRRQKGQSLAEFTLVLPVLLVIVAGVLEISNALNNYNMITASAREAARFGAAGGSDEGIVDVAAQALGYDTPAEANGRLEVWVVRPVADTGQTNWFWRGDTSRATWGDATPACAFPQVAGTPTCTLTGFPGSTPMSTIERIQNAPRTNDTYASGVTGTRFVAVSVYYRVESILNLPFFQVEDASGFIPMASQAIMRQEVEQSAISGLEEGCSLYPIGYDIDVVADSGTRTFADAREGDVFRANRGDTGFEFLAWRNVTQADLITSLTAPNSKDGVNGYLELPVTTPQDTSVNINDMVVLSDAINVGAVSTILDGHMTQPLNDDGEPVGLPRALRILIFDGGEQYEGGSGLYQVQVTGFAVVRITDYDSTALNWLEVEFVRWDATCGQDILGS